jgi:hypothetical protein
LRHNPDGTVAVVGGMLDVPVAPTAARAIPKLSDRPANLPPKD